MQPNIEGRVFIAVNVAMRCFFYSTLLLLGPVAVAQASSAQSIQDWDIASAPARFIVEQDASGPNAVSWINLSLPDPNWLNLPIRVITDKGVSVASDILWTAPGEPATLLIDSSSGADQYKIYLGSNWPAMHLNGLKSGVLMESRAGDGRAINHLKDMIEAWNKSTTVYGRALVGGLFEQGNPFGPQTNLFEHFQGWFDVARPENLQLNLNSNDASFVLVDGKEVVEAPGLHTFHQRQRTQYQGAINLVPGPHLLEAYYAFVPNHDQRHFPLCGLEAKTNTSRQWQWEVLLPNSGFFRPIGHVHVVDYQLESNNLNAWGMASPPPFAINWLVDGQSVIGTDIPDIGLISVQFSCYPQWVRTAEQTLNAEPKRKHMRDSQPTDKITWTFDDGTTAEGAVVEHIFPRPGMRVVKVSVTDGEKNLGAVSQTINVHPNWMQSSTVDPELDPVHQADLMTRDPMQLSASDLAGCMAVFGFYKDSAAMLKFLPAVCSKMNDMNEADLPYLKTAGLYFAWDDPLHFTEGAQLLKALVDRCSTAKSTPQLLIAGNQARLALAQSTLKISDHTDDVKALLDGINVQVLSADEHRSLDILRADLALATGDVANAKKQYQKLAGPLSGADTRSSIRFTAMISQAGVYIDKKDYESAEKSLSQVIAQDPLEKISPDWALTRLRLYEDEKLPEVAYLWGTRLLPVITDNSRSELLFRLTDLAFAQGKNDAATKTLTELLHNYPYSGEAARAKEKWPTKT